MYEKLRLDWSKLICEINELGEYAQHQLSKTKVIETQNNKRQGLTENWGAPSKNLQKREKIRIRNKIKKV